ncbi:hypothetical protein [Flavisolibacter nicotianae]|uniref:hypothetical protein n=1 Tax=Flavisolibacter nicotianae TaxID=2364882 RepID=UPI000EAF6228|nr:hypothetical protein [Flavisolibacter nicotianae]
MKKVFSSLLAVCLLAACGNDKTTKSETETNSTTTGPGTPAVENVNGNVPDTANSVTLNKPLPKDSSSVNDSAAHH